MAEPIHIGAAADVPEGEAIVVGGTRQENLHADAFGRWSARGMTGAGRVAFPGR